MKKDLNEKKDTAEYEESWKLIASELEGLYLEADKLSKKSPVTKTSNLELDSVNYVIKQVKSLLEGDLYIDRLSVFVSAGDNPEYREILLVLRQLIQGMNRHRIPNSSLRIKID